MVKKCLICDLEARGSMAELRLQLKVDFQMGGKRLTDPFGYFVLSLTGSKFLG